MQLHELHARSLESAVILADGAARRMERLLVEAGQEGLIRPISNSLSPDSGEKLLAQVREFSARPVDIRQVLSSEVSALWVIFEDCRPSRMRGYGQDFSPEASAALDAFVALDRAVGGDHLRRRSRCSLSNPKHASASLRKLCVRCFRRSPCEPWKKFNLH
jgi:hypothetical protein